MAVTASSTTKQPPANWAAYAVAVWAFAFAALSFYWACGGTAVAGAVSPQAEQMAKDRVWWFMLLLAFTGFVKVFLGMIALAMVRPWGERFPRWMRVFAGGSVGLIVMLYGGVQLALSAPVYAGVVVAPRAPERKVLRWHVFLWQPYWIVGGIFLITATVIFWRRTRRRRAGEPTAESAPAAARPS